VIRADKPELAGVPSIIKLRNDDMMITPNSAILVQTFLVHEFCNTWISQKVKHIEK
jgi:hypothetical protein